MKTLSRGTIQFLEKLDYGIQHCKKCKLYKGGRAKPYWSEHSRFGLVGETPWTEEVEQNEVFVGQTGELLWRINKIYGLKKRDFIVINSVNCKPSVNPTNKPTLGQLQLCHPWIRLYMKAIKPEKILVMGNYAMTTMTGTRSGIVGLTGKVEAYYPDIEKFPSFKILQVLSVHPSYAIYNKVEGLRLLKKGIKKFKLL